MNDDDRSDWEEDEEWEDLRSRIDDLEEKEERRENHRSFQYKILAGIIAFAILCWLWDICFN